MEFFKPIQARGIFRKYGKSRVLFMIISKSQKMSKIRTEIQVRKNIINDSLFIYGYCSHFSDIYFRIFINFVGGSAENLP